MDKLVDSTSEVGTFDQWIWVNIGWLAIYQFISTYNPIYRMYNPIYNHV